MSEDIIEDITEEALLEDQELVQDTAEEVTEAQSYSDAIRSVLLGESKASKKEESDDEEEEEEEDEEEEMEEGYKKKTESEDEDEESEDEDEEEEEMEEGYMKASKSKEEESDDEEEEEEEDEEEEMEEAKQPTATGDAEDAVVVKDGEAEADATASEIKKTSKSGGKQPAAAGDAKKVKPPTEVDSVKSVNAAAKVKVAEDLDLLISAEANLTEDFKSKASVLFEAAVSQKIVSEKQRLQEEYQENLVEEVTEIREGLIAKIDDYLNYVVESWVEENQVAVDSKLRTEIAENFMGSLKNLFVESYIEVPDAKVDLFDNLEKETSQVKESLEKATAEVTELSEKVEELTREKIISEQTKDLAATQVEKMKSLTEEIEFVSEEAFAEKVATIKSSVFSSSKSKEIIEDTESETEIIVEGMADVNEHLSNDMKKYLAALTRIKENEPNGK
jgi:hypothetical protein